jgi:hypothetical protein
MAGDDGHDASETVWFMRLPDNPEEREHAVRQILVTEPGVDVFTDTSVGSLVRGRTRQGRMTARLCGCSRAVVDGQSGRAISSTS